MGLPLRDDPPEVLREITIKVRGPNWFDVHVDDRYHDRLCWDEMLGQVAHLTHPEIAKPRYDMRTKEEWEEFEKRREERYAASHAQPGEQQQ